MNVTESFKQVSSHTAFRNPYYTIDEEQYTLPNGSIGTYYAVRGLHTAFVVPFVSATEIIVLKQFRYLYQEYAWEFPAGRVDPGEDSASAARRELEEEAGYTAGHLEHVGWFAPCNGLTDERTEVYVATNLTKTDQQLENTEAIETHIVSIDEFERMIDNNEARDGMTITAWRLAQSKRKELFS